LFLILGCVAILSGSYVFSAQRGNGHHHPTPTPTPAAPIERVIHGLIQSDGAIIAGSGFTVEISGVGLDALYTVNFDEPFLETPGVALTTLGEPNVNLPAVLGGMGPASIIYRPSEPSGANVSFIAIGLR